jgi:hypothetical protein
MSDELQVPPERIVVDTALLVLASAEFEATGEVSFEPRVYFLG